MFVLGLFLGFALYFVIAIAFASPVIGVLLSVVLISIAIAAHRGKLHWEEWDMNE